MVGAHGWATRKGGEFRQKKKQKPSSGSVSVNEVQGVSYMGSGVYIWVGYRVEVVGAHRGGLNQG